MMQLGMISHYTHAALAAVKSKDLSYVEFTINRDENIFFESLSDIKKNLTDQELSVFSIGRWGTTRINEHGVNEEELSINLKMIDACATLGSPLYVTGVNYIFSLSKEDNINYALSYLKRLMAYAKEKNIGLAVYNCRWHNFITGPEMWDIVLKEVKGLGIKYDPSHAIYDHQDYLNEIKTYGQHIYHIHLKGSLMINQERVDDPPAGLDMTDWKAVMALLYVHQYKGGLSIEPHSNIWKNELGDFGIDYTISYFKPMIYGGKL
jgi:sugar phosphate isomerase/epimerase